MISWFVSDIHLKDEAERSSEILLRFLRSLGTEARPATHLFLLGDIFDVWVGGGWYFQKRFQSLINEIRNLQKRNVEVVFFEGNHDLHVKKFWEKKLKIPVYDDVQIFDLGTYRVRCEHGDFINTKDLAYIRYRKTVRSSFFKFLGESLPGYLWQLIAERASRHSRKISTTYRKESQEDLRTMIHVYAEKSYQQTPYDFMFTGHMHIADEYQVRNLTDPSTGRGYLGKSINLGSWFDGAKVGKLSDHGFEWIDLETES